MKPLDIGIVSLKSLFVLSLSMLSFATRHVLEYTCGVRSFELGNAPGAFAS
ncbi:MAG: hypothetical protein JWO19_1740 [Bryobacterales bacterium]|jgi:hypothetical protein|nr:hypothetical protein [Bryobacterales bacterium]